MVLKFLEETANSWILSIVYEILNFVGSFQGFLILPKLPHKKGCTLDFLAKARPMISLVIMGKFDDE